MKCKTVARKIPPATLRRMFVRLKNENPMLAPTIAEVAVWSRVAPRKRIWLVINPDIPPMLNALIKNDHTRTLEKGNETITVSKGNRVLDVKNKISTNASDIVITGKKSIELKVGGSSIKMTSSGIVIKATKIDVKGSAMVAIKGGITKIN